MPYQTIARDSATTTFSLDLTLAVLGLIYAEHADRHGTPARFETLINSDQDDDDELMDFPDTPAYAVPLPTFSRTAADLLAPDEIAKSLERDIDPFATAHDGSTRTWQPKLPLDRMRFAARFAAIFTDYDIAVSLMTPQAVTLLSVPDDIEREAFSDHFPNILENTARALSMDGIELNGIAIAVLPSLQPGTSSRGHAEFNSKIDRVIAEGNSLIVIAKTREDLPTSGKMLCSSVISLPPITGKTVVEILRQTHSVTGQVSDAAIAERLPNNKALEKLPMPLLKSAFCEPTTLSVANRLQALSGHLQTRPDTCVPTLDAIYLPPQARDDMQNLVTDLAQWQAGDLAWSEVTSSVLIYGPPGTGKTLLAKGLAGSARIPLIATSYGQCQKADEAILRAPSVFFIDELDSFSKRSTSNRNGGYVSAIVNALLEHLTRLNDTAGIVVLGATNLPENVDAAVIRPGRFDRHTALENPDREGIVRIFEIELGACATDLDLGQAADRLLGMSGAQVAAVVRDARGKARRAKTALSNAHLAAALDQVAPEGQYKDLYRVAIHEAGNAVVAHLLGLPLPAMVRVTHRGGAYVGKAPFAATKQIICDQIAVTLGGRAAEAVILGSVSNGAESDLVQATEVAFRARYTCGL